uniref:Uncharacterized protein n=1 Tax=Setaria digitata TaxID=48799 RepID=A0A915PCL5_9BILA
MHIRELKYARKLIPKTPQFPRIVTFQSDGELENEETVAVNIQEMVSIGESLIRTTGKIEKMAITYPEYCLEVVRSGKYIFIVKKKMNC